ncbi:MAG: hypothetical protein HPY75_13625, partial [Actinobacteria bacterium]|nr:hypothetical protein [Actinomycetota bacterium]
MCACRRPFSSAFIYFVSLVLLISFFPLGSSLGFPTKHESFAAQVDQEDVQPGQVWYLAEGYTGGEFDTWVLVQNPGDEDAKVTLSFQLPPGTSADPINLDVP